MRSINDCSTELARLSGLIRQANRVLVGVGEGFSAAAGLDWGDPKLARDWLPGFTEIGLRDIRDIADIIGPIQQNRPEVYWGFWGQLLHLVHNETPALPAYRRLAALLAGKDVFFCAATTDGQLYKAGFAPEQVFAPLGDGRYFQCSKPCGSALYENGQQVRTMVEYLMTPREIDTRDIPECPSCGAPLLPNLRVLLGDAFVEEPHLEHYSTYLDFLKASAGLPTLLLELGVGAGEGEDMIRRPFTQHALIHPEAVLVSVGPCAETPAALGERGLALDLNPAQALDALPL